MVLRGANPLPSPMRRILFALVVLAGIFTPVAAHALTSGCYTYTVSGSSATITDATACTGVIIVPSTLGGNTVVALGAYAFRGAATLTSVTLPDTVVTLNSYTFYQLPQLTYLNLGNGVATLSFTNVMDCPLLSTLLLGTGFRTLGSYATSGDSSLKTLNLPSGTTTLNTYAFGNNSSVVTVTIPASVATVQTYAFLNSSLTNITYAGYAGPVISQLISTFGNCGWSGPAACTTGPAFYLSSISGLASTRSTFSGYSITTTRGTGTIYSIDPAISNGLSFNTTTGRISGRPTVDAGPVTYTITGTNSSGYSTATYTISVDSTHQYIICDPFFMITTLHVRPNDSLIFSTCPGPGESVNGVNSNVISLVGIDLSFRQSTFTIFISNSVSPGTFVNAFTLNAFNQSTQFNIIVDVAGPAAPAFTFSSSSETATVGTAIASYSISSTGGPIDSYSISPDISVTPNNGLSFNTSTGLITGTPTVAASAVTYAITGTNTSGSATATYSVAAITPPAISISHGKIAMSISQSTLSGGAGAIGEVTLDAPIICANQSGSCEVTISMTSNNPTRLSISPQSLTWSATTWARPQFFIINSSLTGMTAASEIVTVSTTSAISQSEYYLGFAIPRILFTVNNPNWVAPVPVPVPVPDPVQQSKISGITPTTGVAGTPVTVTASGNFVEKISAIQIDGIRIAVGSWTQTPTSVTFTIPNKSAGSYSIQIYNGSAPVLAAQRFTVTAVPIPASLNPAPKQKKIYISCAKPGHGTRIAYGVNPVCPAGYVKK
jgi:hypothetical protein